MRLSFQEYGVEISELGCRGQDLFRNFPRFDFLNIYWMEEKISVAEDKIFIPSEVISDFTPAQLAKLKLPPPFPHVFSCKSFGTVLQDNYEIVPIFKTKLGRPLGDYQQKGTFISFSGEKYTLPRQIYRSLSLIKEINQTKVQGKKLEILQSLKEFLVSTSGSEELEDINVIIAQNFSLEITDEEDFIVSPTFVQVAAVDDQEDEIGESTSEDAGDLLLTSDQSEEYHRRFRGYKEVKPHIQVANNTFLVLGGNLKKIMRVIKNAQTKRTVAARRALFVCPNTYLQKELGNDFTDEVAEAFVPHAQYISDRVSHIGVWTPKSQVFLPTQNNEWIPKELVGVRLSNELIFANPKELPSAVTKMQEAVEAGKKTVNISNQKVQATQENIDILKKVDTTSYKEGMGDHQWEDYEGKEKEAKITAIIKDNIKGDNYQEDTVLREKQKKFLPSSLKTRDLYPHQKRGVSWLQESWNSGKRGVLLADDMGLGKTLQVLVFLAWLRETGCKQKTFLIVAPTGLLKNWQDEHSTHLLSPGLGRLTEGYGEKLKNLRSGSIENAVDCLSNTDLVLTTYQSLALNENIFRCVAWQIIVFDECQAIKNPATYRTDMAKAMAAEFSIGVTGTPVENSLGDLWCIADAVSPGLLKTYKEFKVQYEKEESGPKKLTNKLKHEISPPFILRRMKEKHLDGLPQKKEIIKDKEMPESQAHAYCQVIEDIQRGRYGKNTLNAIQKLRAISLFHREGTEDMNDSEFIASSARLSALFEILNEIENRGEKALIFLESRELQGKLIALIQRRYALREPPQLINGSVQGHIRKAKVDVFQQMPPGFAVMVISPKAGGTGLTITKANNVIHLDRWWNPAVEDQCSDRVYRIGQDKDVNIYVIRALYPNRTIKSYDEVLHEILSKKRKLSKKVIVPTTFNTEDLKSIFKESTGCEYKHDDRFYHSEAWRNLRYQIIDKYGRKCQKCGVTASESSLHVDHIKPRSKYPKLELDPENLQVLCKDCNLGKSNKYEDDYRKAL